MRFCELSLYYAPYLFRSRLGLVSWRVFKNFGERGKIRGFSKIPEFPRILLFRLIKNPIPASLHSRFFALPIPCPRASMHFLILCSCIFALMLPCTPAFCAPTLLLPCAHSCFFALPLFWLLFLHRASVSLRYPHSFALTLNTILLCRWKYSGSSAEFWTNQYLSSDTQEWKPWRQKQRRKRK